MKTLDQIDIKDYQARLDNITNSNLSTELKIKEWNKIMQPLYEIDRLGYDPHFAERVIRPLEVSIPGFVFDFKIDELKSDQRQKEYDVENAVNYIRKRYSMYGFDFNIAGLTGECKEITFYITQLLQRQGIKCRPIYFTNQFVDHWAVIAEVTKNDAYLIDCTYQQFFLACDNLPSRHVTKDGISVGAFVGNTMIQNGNADIAQEIIQKGYIRVDSVKFKAYMDGFINTFHCLEEQNRYSGYSSNDYYQAIIDNPNIGKTN